MLILRHEDVRLDALTSSCLFYFPLKTQFYFRARTIKEHVMRFKLEYHSKIHT